MPQLPLWIWSGRIEEKTRGRENCRRRTLKDQRSEIVRAKALDRSVCEKAHNNYEHSPEPRGKRIVDVAASPHSSGQRHAANESINDTKQPKSHTLRTPFVSSTPLDVVTSSEVSLRFPKTPQSASRT